jgi:hypothetical protein
MNFDGGFGCRPGSESHSGQIYCCVGMLAIVGQLHHINADLLGWWLCERQLPSGTLAQTLQHVQHLYHQVFSINNKVSVYLQGYKINIKSEICLHFKY